MTTQPTTQHFRLLDGLRGLAAAIVVVYHFGTRSDIGLAMPHGYLAVDFFFVLSGLVVGHAYSRRLAADMTASRFLLRRWIRLWPMIVPGTLFAAAIEFWRPGDAAGHGADVIRSALLGSFAVPWPFHSTLEQTIFPLNGPVWSLFFEIFASLVFVAVARRGKLRSGVPILIALGALGLYWCVMTTGTVDTGPYVDNWIGGFARVCLSFFIGVRLVSARRHIPPMSVWVYPVVLLGVFMMPVGNGIANRYFEAIVVLIVFPLVVASASHCVISPRLGQLSDLSGEISYPLYALHYPMVRAICFAMNHHGFSPRAQMLICVASVLAISIIAWLAARVYDRPFRAYLTRRFDPDLRARARQVAALSRQGLDALPLHGTK